MRSPLFRWQFSISLAQRCSASLLALIPLKNGLDLALFLTSDLSHRILEVRLDKLIPAHVAPVKHAALLLQRGKQLEGGAAAEGSRLLQSYRRVTGCYRRVTGVLRARCGHVTARYGRVAGALQRVQTRYSVFKRVTGVLQACHRLSNRVTGVLQHVTGVLQA
jgi:hypothetical protein